MSLAVGTRLGAYEITGPIGAGGMGEVYRARDTKLGRDVAIKVLPEAFAEDAERLARFEREAKLLASLNHPNIAAIYGVEENALVLELVDGPTLAERIEAGRIPIDEAVAIARQIADALEAGHEAGVIHRDLKPANVKVKEDGTVKVLDYGLAKALEGDAPDATDPGLSQSPTLTRQGTQVGVILGTTAYMSPEQARGKRVDRRTDIWAFGCVLYELLTGKKAFDGEDVSEILAAVINLEPDWNALDPRLEKVVRRTLAKDPKERRRDIGDVRADIDEALEASEHRFATSGGRWIALGTAVAGALAGVAVTTLMSTPSMNPPVIRFNIAREDEAVSAARRVAITKDGRTIAYPIDGTLHVRSLDSAKTTPLSGTHGAGHAVFSPEYEWVAFWSDGLQKVSVDGGAPVRLCCENWAGGSTSWEGEYIYFGDSEIVRVSANGGEPEIVLDSDEEDYSFPRLLPDGKTLLFTVDTMTTPTRSIAVLDLDTGERRRLVDVGADAQYVASGHLVYRVGGTLRAVPFDLGRVAVTGPEAIVVQSVAPLRRTGGTDSGGGDFVVSESGNLVYHSAGAALDRLVWVDRRGVKEPLEAAPAGYTDARLSPDGARLVLELEGDLWLYDLARNTMSRLTFTADNLRAMWTQDGDTIVFASRSDGVHQLFLQRADGSGDAEQLTTGDLFLHPDAVSPDGAVIFHEHTPDNASDLWLLDMVERERRPLLQTQFREELAAVSPDGRWLAYTSNESGKDEVYARPFPDAGAKTLISTDGGTLPLWAKDGRELFYRNEDKLMSVDVDSGDVLTVGTPEVLFEARFVPGVRAPSFDVTADGERFLIIESSENARAQLHVVVNFSEELKRVAPAEN